MIRAGSEALRTQIAQHLAAHRGIRCYASRILVVSGTQHGLRMSVEALLSPGDAVWMEDPGYYAARATLEASGMRIVPVPVDVEGIVVAAGRRKSDAARAVDVTPSHQFPSGVTDEHGAARRSPRMGPFVRRLDIGRRL